MDALDIELAEQRSQTWFDIRLGRFTSSEIYKIMQSGRGANKTFSDTGYTYIATKAGEHLTGVKVENPYAAALVYGEEMEPVAKEYFKKHTGWEIANAEFVPFTDHAGGSPDGYVLGADSKIQAGIEIKCPYNSANQVEYLLLEDQSALKANYPQYYWQIMSAMLFTNLSTWYFITYDPRMKKDNHKLKIIEVYADYQDQKLIADRIELAIEEKLKIINRL